MADLEPTHNMQDIDDANGPVNTRVLGSNTVLLTDGDASGTTGVPVFSKKYRIDFSETDTSLSTTTYVTRYTYSGSGKFVGFIIGSSSTNVKCRFTVDSEEVFDLTTSNIQDIQSSNPGNSGPSAESSAGGPQFDISDRKVVFYPPYPIQYESSILLEVARDVVGGPDPVVQRHMFVLTKET